uniref:Rhodanese domain-containing protein n=1 Tax=Aegilops tauschii subsp. strangulata TaxID=200361 RepID=A0A453MP86_AEGTS
MGSLGSSDGEKRLPVESVNTEAACALLASEQYGYVDVRMWEDFDRGHVAGARNVPYYLSVNPHGKERNLDFVDQVAALHSTHDRLIVGCRSGVRSRLATADLVAAVSSSSATDWSNLLTY